MDQREHVAAALAAALIKSGEAQNPDDAAGLYFKCLEALEAAEQHRKQERSAAKSDAPRPEVHRGHERKRRRP